VASAGRKFEVRQKRHPALRNTQIFDTLNQRFTMARLTVLVLSFLVVCRTVFGAGEHPTLAIGSRAPDFNLKGVDGKNYSLASFASSPILVVVFTCNHCPTAQAYEDRIIRLTSDYASRGVAVVAISPNDPKAIRTNELDYTDLSDT